MFMEPVGYSEGHIIEFRLASGILQQTARDDSIGGYSCLTKLWLLESRVNKTG